MSQTGSVHPRHRLRAPRLASWARRLAATDPGHARAVNAAAIALAVAISATVAWSLVHFGHNDHALLAMGPFLALFSGLVVKDSTRRDRLITTALLVFPLLTTLSLGSLLDRWRAVEIIVFIGVAGTATWLRKYGPRANALGMMAFFGMFFAVFLRPPVKELPEFWLVAACAVGSVLLIRLAFLRSMPRRQITTLLREFRGACVYSLDAALAAKPGPSATDQRRLGLSRIDDVSRAIDTWQSEFRTEAVIHSEATTFAAAVLDARISVEHACLEILRCQNRGGADAPSGALTAAAHELRTALLPGASPTDVAAAAERARAYQRPIESDSPDELAVAITHRAVVAQVTLRTIDLTHPIPQDPNPQDPNPEARSPEARSPEAPSSPPATAPVTPPAQAGPPQPPSRLRPWLGWEPTTRMAAQVMVAAALSTVVGELISADRWYWAVITSFMIFTGATTRSGILTKAWRRLLGTVGGVTIGFGIAFLLAGNPMILILLCVTSVFCMLYFGPLNYLWQALFVTILVASLFGLLGILTPHVLELRIAETAAGVVIGTASAYLVFSTSSRPALLRQMAAYFDALDHLLAQVRAALSGPGLEQPVLVGVGRLDTAQVALQDFTKGMSMGFLNGKRGLAASLGHLMTVITQRADQISRVAVVSTSAPPAPHHDVLVPILTGAVDHVQASSHRARAALIDNRYADTRASDTTVIDMFEKLPPGLRIAQVDVAQTLSQLNWALLRVVEVREHS